MKKENGKTEMGRAPAPLGNFLMSISFKNQCKIAYMDSFEYFVIIRLIKSMQHNKAEHRGRQNKKDLIDVLRFNVPNKLKLNCRSAVLRHIHTNDDDDDDDDDNDGVDGGGGNGNGDGGGSHSQTGTDFI
uniref:Uncharacterized protein n=1 Tax=Glossina brevipalpis TaxID=37001 RepID=A0A1A9WHS7_9MUSC